MKRPRSHPVRWRWCWPRCWAPLPRRPRMPLRATGPTVGAAGISTRSPSPSRPNNVPLPDRPNRGPPLRSPRKPQELVEVRTPAEDPGGARNIAIMRPTEANVRRYMELESQVVARASYFADVARAVAWATPALDPTLPGDARSMPRRWRCSRQTEQASAPVRSPTGQDHVLFFFYRSDRPYCHAFCAYAWRPSRRATASRSSPSASMAARCRASPEARTDNGIAHR